jgi:hypothetical protein
MKSVLIRVAEKVGGQYPVTLQVDAAGGTNFSGAALATDSIPPDLAVGDAPLHPVDGTPLEGFKAREYLERKSTNAALIERTGALLFKTLSRPKIEAAWGPLREEARTAAARGVALRTFLDIAPSELRALPWEAMRTQGDIVARRAKTPFMRWGTRRARPKPAIPWPLRVLLVIGCEANDAAVEWRAELDAVIEALCPMRHAIDLDYFDCRRRHPQGSITALSAFIRDFEPDILHFIGHGKGATAHDSAGLVVFDAGLGQGTNQLWRAPDIATALGNAGTVPRLALLNACRSADFPATGAWNIADELLAAGVDAVLGMQGEVAGGSAARFAAAFYKAVIEQKPIDVAMIEGRDALASQAPSAPDWVFPSLILRVDPEEVLRMEQRADAALTQSVQLHQDLACVHKSFVDRRLERRAVVTAPRRAGPGGLFSNVSLIKGKADIGKTWMLKCALSAALTRGFQVVYVDLAEYARQTAQRPNLSAIDFMRAIRGPAKPPPKDVLRPRLYGEFARFNDAVTALIEGRVPPDAPASGVDSERDWTPDGAAHPDTIDIASEAFLETLRRISASAPMVIAVDHLVSDFNGVRADQFKQFVRPFVIDPIAQGRYQNLYLLIAAPAEAAYLGDLGLDTLDVAGVTCELQEFPVEEWDLLAREFAAHRGWQPADRTRLWRLIEKLTDIASVQPWDAGLLGDFESLWMRMEKLRG